jgi:hypothetical protein
MRIPAVVRIFHFGGLPVFSPLYEAQPKPSNVHSTILIANTADVASSFSTIHATDYPGRCRLLPTSLRFASEPQARNKGTSGHLGFGGALDL